MNTHLNIFRTYAKENRSYQLENDLTRAFAISMQENPLFFNDVLRSILDSKYSNELFNDLDSENEISINIQKHSSDINGFEKIYAVSLSEYEMKPDQFWNQKNETRYDPICDIVIKLNEFVIVIEAKRDNVDCTSQLYNQVFNICKNNEISPNDMGYIVVPVDLNWAKLMEKAVMIHSFEKATGNPNRFLNDFIELVKTHNYSWFPEPSIFSVSSNNKNAIRRRIESAINEINKKGDIKKLEYSDRLGLRFDQPWAQEVLFDISKEGDLVVTIYPGNTKAQGSYIFSNNPRLKDSIDVNSKQYEVFRMYHIKFTSFQSYFTGLWFEEKELKKELYTKDNFWKFCGRKKRGQDWVEIEDLFNRSFTRSYKWKEECNWDSKIINSGRNQFDLSFGYELSVAIPFQELRRIDSQKNDLTGLSNFISAIYKEFRTLYK